MSKKELSEEELAKKKKRKPLKITLISIASVIGAAVIAAGSYVVYVIASYNRIGNVALDITHKASQEKMATGTTYSATSYNIGFGAYSQNYTFFLDTGYDDAGNETCGHYSKALSKEDCAFNTDGAIQTIKNLNPTFAAFQEVDTNSTRSYHINQDDAIQEAFGSYDHTHAINFHTAFLPYPLYDMHGKVNAGLTTLSSFKVQEAERKEYTVSSSLSRLFDLDRCFTYQKVDVENGKSFYFVNHHMSAYDSGGTIRAKQVEEMNAFLKERKDNGDYVVLAGDFNHDLLTNNPDFSYDAAANRAFHMTKKTPDWVSFYFDDSHKSPLIDGYKVVASDNYPTCRNNDIEWEPGNTFVCAIDGFVVSDNIEVVSHQNIQTKNGNKHLDGFAYSDHDPTMLEFKLL